MTTRISDWLFRKPNHFLILLFVPPLLWLGVVYVGSLLTLLVHAFFSIDEFSGFIVYDWTFSTIVQLFRPANYDVIIRTVIWQHW
jgi:putative spermidine/putrescine transport system permease protein